MSNLKKDLQYGVAPPPSGWPATDSRSGSVDSTLKNWWVRHRKLGLHLGVWILYTSFEIILLYFLSGGINLWEACFNLSLNAIAFYVNALLLLPRFFGRKHYLGYSLSLLLTFIGYAGMKYLLNNHITPVFNAELISRYVSEQYFLANAIWRFSQFVMYSFGYWYAVSAISHEREKRELELMKLDNERRIQSMEKNLREAEITYLKYQINPHFLFNTLNFVYERVQHHSDEAARGVLLLSEMMRYALTPSEANAKVLLDSEIRHLKNYIEIHQMRFNHRLQVDFAVAGPTHYRMIIPLVLVTFVENCFKHGELLDARHPLTIRLSVEGDELSFSTHNRKKIGPTERSEGIGLSNTRRRLEAIYGDRYRLRVEDGPEFFTSHLTIEL